MARKSEKASCWIIVLALTLWIKCFSCNFIYPKSSRLKKRASRKHLEASVEKREPRGTFLSLGLWPRLQKPFPRFPFFYLGFKNLLLAALYFTLDNLGKIKLHLKHFSWELPEQLFQQNTISSVLIMDEPIVKHSGTPCPPWQASWTNSSILVFLHCPIFSIVECSTDI